MLLAGVEIPPEAAAKAEAAAAAVEPSASPTTGGGQAGAAPRRPGEVLAAALQLAPEQLQGTVAHGERAGARSGTPRGRAPRGSRRVFLGRGETLDGPSSVRGMPRKSAS